ncbi:hypothetical protein [Tepidibacter thalassicus]|uniref:Nitrogen regulatory protein P-II family n=1 Tax=Tepidibacter thalassicus DSM 15285 TaxID=1123350 RepID=A0A1M5PGB4_9FIRM|nr:hypothetical protein [Tepidibacter thalassicus]SHH00778.1 hypothetical protein SAMN02744040_00468 [Tepidibacter thalassicus DSM 15285]
MNALFLVLNKVDKLDDILDIFFHLGLGATVIDSEGMGKVLLEHDVDVPIFSGIKKLIEGHKPYNKTIVSVIRDEFVLRKAVNKIKEELNYIEKPGVGFLFVVPVTECHGFGVDEMK